ncbi:hypothetical protein [Streptomyces sp. NBC_00724]|uniref:hypothetical protein n=1 Tax=Streptomyces sp. NBC_00724 TaxID=2975812 RepID=UPI002ED00824|nr:hypothetical protein OHB17_00125 [Streptomyces sp. NBC_00724]WTI92720.1 hypothetical protein OHB17_41880 [Streptomyces sp. NBC_00724]
MDGDTWVEQGQKIGTANELREYVAAIGAEVQHMQTGLGRAAGSVLRGRSWLDTPRDERFDHPDLLREQLDMSVTPAGMAAKDAVYRQSLAALLVALDTVAHATLTAWLADINANDPGRPA